MVVTQKGKIMVVDDDDNFRDSLCDIITDWNYECLAVNGAEAALEALRQEHVDLVLLDIRMPGMNGIDCLQEIRRQYPEVRVVMMTAYSEQVEKAVELGAITVLSKPLDVNSLLNLLQERAKKSVVVLLEDGPQLSLDVQAMLKERGLSVGIASSSSETLDLVYRQSPDIVILNTVLSDVNKLRAIAHLRKNMASLPLIAIADYEKETAGLVGKGSEEKVMVFFTRHLQPRELLSILGRIFEDK